jgi:hypothetical protein
MSSAPLSQNTISIQSSHYSNSYSHHLCARLAQSAIVKQLLVCHILPARYLFSLLSPFSESSDVLGDTQ